MPMPMVPIPSAEQVAAYLGIDPIADGDDSDLVLIAGRLPITTALAMSYTRGVGFSDDGTQCRADLAATIISACAREVAMENPGEQRVEVGSMSTWNNATGQLWLLREVLALNNYRRLSQ